MCGIVWRKRAELPRNFGGNLLREWGRSCDEKAGSILGVFGLREKIGSDPTRIAALCEHHGFGGPGGKVDGAVGGDELFCGGDVFVAGPKIFSTRGMDFVP